MDNGVRDPANFLERCRREALSGQELSVDRAGLELGEEVVDFPENDFGCSLRGDDPDNLVRSDQFDLLARCKQRAGYAFEPSTVFNCRDEIDVRAVSLTIYGGWVRGIRCNSKVRTEQERKLKVPQFDVQVALAVLNLVCCDSPTFTDQPDSKLLLRRHGRV